jgi:hypothetical protein
MKVEIYLLIPENYNVDLHTSGGSLSIEDLTVYIMPVPLVAPSMRAI